MTPFHAPQQHLSLGNKKIATTLVAAVDDEAVVAEAALGGRDGAAQRWATTWRGGWFCDSSSCICLLTSLELRVICAFSVGSV